MIEVSEEKKVFRKKIITIISLIISLIGAIITLLLGIDALNRASWWEQSYYYVLIALTALTILGDIVGFYKKAAGIGISFVIGIIGIICVFYYISLFFMGFFIPILMVFIGGLMGVIVNYENFKEWREQKWKGAEKKKGEQKREVKWEKKLWIPGLIFLILGGLFIYLEIDLCATRGVCFIPFAIYFGIIFMIVGPLLIIYSVIKLRM